jgi:hypothetical protein
MKTGPVLVRSGSACSYFILIVRAFKVRILNAIATRAYYFMLRRRVTSSKSWNVLCDDIALRSKAQKIRRRAAGLLGFQRFRSRSGLQ